MIFIILGPQGPLPQQVLELSFTMSLPTGPRACGHPETVFHLLDHAMGTWDSAPSVSQVSCPLFSPLGFFPRAFLHIGLLAVGLTLLDHGCLLDLGFEDVLWALKIPQGQSDVGVGRDGEEEWELE